MSLNFQEEIRSFIRSLPNVELKHDPMSEEAYFYGLRNFAHFHGPRHIDIRLSKTQQEEALRTHMGSSTPVRSTSGMGFMCYRDSRAGKEYEATN
jgi:Luciferase